MAGDGINPELEIPDDLEEKITGGKGKGKPEPPPDPMAGLGGSDDTVGDDIQFEKKEQTLAEKYALYNSTVAQIASYLELGGMFELKDGQTYSIFNNSNVDAFTWKNYDLGASLYYNAHEMQEVKFNVSDAVLLGSTSSVEKLPEIISRFRVNLNM